MLTMPFSHFAEDGSSPRLVHALNDDDDSALLVEEAGVLLVADPAERSEYVFFSAVTPAQATLEPGRLILRGAQDLRSPGYFDPATSHWRRRYTTAVSQSIAKAAFLDPVPHVPPTLRPFEVSRVDLWCIEDEPSEPLDDGEMALWPAALVLARELEVGPWFGSATSATAAGPSQKGTAATSWRVLELGAGAGLPSMVAALRGAAAVATEGGVHGLNYLRR